MGEGTGTQVSTQFSEVIERFSVRYGSAVTDGRMVAHEVVWLLAGGQAEVVLSDRLVTLALHYSGQFLPDFEADDGTPLPRLEVLAEMVEAGIAAAGGLTALAEQAAAYQVAIDVDESAPQPQANERQRVECDRFFGDEERELRCMDAASFLRERLDVVEQQRRARRARLAWEVEQAEAAAFHTARAQQAGAQQRGSALVPAGRSLVVVA